MKRYIYSVLLFTRSGGQPGVTPHWITGECWSASKGKARVLSWLLICREMQRLTIGSTRVVGFSEFRVDAIRFIASDTRKEANHHE